MGRRGRGGGSGNWRAIIVECNVTWKTGSAHQKAYKKHIHASAVRVARYSKKEAMNCRGISNRAWHRSAVLKRGKVTTK